LRDIDQDALLHMVTRVSPEVVRSSQTLEELEKKAMEKVRAHCPNVKWLHSYAILGPYDCLDIFEAPDNETAAKVSTLIRAHGRAHSEIWVATDWERFKQMLHGLGPEPMSGMMPRVWERPALSARLHERIAPALGARDEGHSALIVIVSAAMM